MQPIEDTIKESNSYKLADKLTEILIYFIAIFSPWAFGTTEPWSIWTINIAAYFLGILLFTKWLIRWSHYKQPNTHANNKGFLIIQTRTIMRMRSIDIILISLMLILIFYILTSSINARASFNILTKEYSYYENYKINLPHSYDANASWFIFWQYLGLMMIFWSCRDWVLGGGSQYFKTNKRYKRLLYLICFNCGALCIEALLQRSYFSFSENGKLLFLIEPYLNWNNLAHYGPFAYRSNAASYFNIIAPLSLGILLSNIFDKNKRIGSGYEILMALVLALILFASFNSLSRGGSGVLALLLLFSLIYVFRLSRMTKKKLLALSLTATVLISTSILLSWEQLEVRYYSLFNDPTLGGRIPLFEKTIQLIKEYPYFGSGPGTFETIYQFESIDTNNIWESWAHNDYLEFYLTFGFPGFCIIALILMLIIYKKIRTIWHAKKHNSLMTAMTLLALIGVLTHSIFDFPLQVYSINTLLIIILSPEQ